MTIDDRRALAALAAQSKASDYRLPAIVEVAGAFRPFPTTLNRTTTP